MASLAAEFHRLGELVRFVTAEGSQKKKADNAKREQRQNPPVTFPRQIDMENRVLVFKTPCATLPTPVQDRAENCECEAEKEKEWCDDISKNANVWILGRREEIDREEKNKGEERGGGQHHAGPTNPVLEVAPKGPMLCGNWSVRHRGNYFEAAPLNVAIFILTIRLHVESTSQSCR